MTSENIVKAGDKAIVEIIWAEVELYIKWSHIQVMDDLYEFNLILRWILTGAHANFFSG